MTNAHNQAYPTPYELGNQNQTTTWEQCIRFYEDLAKNFPHILRFESIGISDLGLPIHAGIITADGILDYETLKKQNRPIFFNNNGIHPGEPEGVDTCMAIVRDFCIHPERLNNLGQTVFLFIPVYNVDGCVNRNRTSRANQEGPEMHGFRGNSRHLDLNRDFTKCDSLSARTFNEFFTQWDPDVMVDTHTSNGADYQYAMTLIQTQANKLGDELGNFLRNTMLPTIYQHMAHRGWPTCPYVNPVKEIPDDGIMDFLETPRFSTGYAALHHTIGFMPETHMLKPFADRYESTRALVEVVLSFTIQNATQIQTLRAHAKQADYRSGKVCPIQWEADMSQHREFYFHGYEAEYSPSKLGNYTRLSYNRSKPFAKNIPYYDEFKASRTIVAPQAYLIPQTWREIIERLRWNKVELERIEATQEMDVECYRIEKLTSRPTAYEGHMFHDTVHLTRHKEKVKVYQGDYLCKLNQTTARYIVEMLEPEAHDSFFRWGFCNAVLERKEHYSDYVFEDLAYEILEKETALQSQFENWKKNNPHLLNHKKAVLDFIYTHCAQYVEPEYLRYPIFRIV